MERRLRAAFLLPSAQRRIPGRHQKAVLYPFDDNCLRLGLGAFGYPFLVALKRVPLLLAISVVQKPTGLIPYFSQNFRVMFSKRAFNAGRRPGAQW
jgi:hypothetical protein